MKNIKTLLTIVVVIVLLVLVGLQISRKTLPDGNYNNQSSAVSSFFTKLFSSKAPEVKNTATEAEDKCAKLQAQVDRLEDVVRQLRNSLDEMKIDAPGDPSIPHMEKAIYKLTVDPGILPYTQNLLADCRAKFPKPVTEQEQTDAEIPE